MKSIEIKFNEALAAIDKAGKRKTFDEKAKACTTIESKLNAAEAVLQDVGVVRAKESRPIKKNNGADDNFAEGNPFRPVEEFRENFSAGYVKEANKVCPKGDKIMIDHMLKRGEITEAQHRKLLGLKPVEYDQLNEVQRKEFDFACMCGISESDAFKLARMAGTTFREVSRR